MPSPLITHQKVRLSIDMKEENGIQDALTGRDPFFFRGSDIQFELGFFFGDDLVDMTNVASVTIVIKSTLLTGTAAQMTKTNATVDLTLASATWIDGTKQHVKTQFTDAETNLDLSSAASGLFWLSVYMTTTTGEIVTAGVARIKVVEDAVPTDGDLPIQAGNLIQDSA